MLVEVDHAEAGPIPLVGSPMKFSAMPSGAVKPPPLLGEHTAQVLEQLLGLDGAAIDRLRDAAII
jgi:crotonobetainyl-CoA:carnitine CoA-transferase CaiB-like acyl-CoA transferase